MVPQARRGPSLGHAPTSAAGRVALPTSTEARPAWPHRLYAAGFGWVVEATGGGQRRAPRPSAVGVLFGVWSVVASGCALDTPAKYLAPEGAQSYLIIEVGGEGISVEALGRPEGRSYDGDDLRQLYVLGYAESLAQLGLPAGLLRVDAKGGPLPKPIWIRGLDHAANEDGTFESLAELPAMIRDLRLAEVSPCPDLVPDALTYGPNAGRTYFFVKLDADRGLLGSSAGPSARSPQTLRGA